MAYNSLISPELDNENDNKTNSLGKTDHFTNDIHDF